MRPTSCTESGLIAVKNEKVDPEKLRRDREELEKRQKEGTVVEFERLVDVKFFCCLGVSGGADEFHSPLPEKARLQAEAKAAEVARKKAEAEALAESLRKREAEREAARMALQQVL